jgi:hypothetical protein
MKTFTSTKKRLDHSKNEFQSNFGISSDWLVRTVIVCLAIIDLVNNRLIHTSTFFSHSRNDLQTHLPTSGDLSLHDLTVPLVEVDGDNGDGLPHQFEPVTSEAADGYHPRSSLFMGHTVLCRYLKSREKAAVLRSFSNILCSLHVKKVEWGV